MKQLLRIAAVLIAASVLGTGVAKAEITRKQHIEHRDSTELVIVNGDTISMIIDEPNFGRFDRGLFNYIFIPKGKWGFGITASYGELSTEDVQMLSMLTDLDVKGKMYSLNPSVSYFFANNKAVGLKFNYNRGTADLGSLGFDFDEDLSFNIGDISYYQQSFGVSTFYRGYVGLDTNGRFGIFNEVDLDFSSGSSRFKRLYDGAPRDTRTIVTQGSLNFSPGVCVFIQDMVSFNISFGVFGLKWRHESQSTDGVFEGSRTTSGANFRFNIFNINFGLMVVI
ncbi:MAG: hypothetical protein HDS65_09745 [Bacteroidales bacterium]|nr:hypothetical protein [Bacteroidales bacterium]